MNRRILLILILIIALGISGCSPAKEIVEEQIQEPEENKEPEEVQPIKPVISVVTTLFPQFDFARSIGGEYIDVTLLLPPGIEAHSFEPTPQDIVKLLKADLLLYTGELMEPWIINIIMNLENENVMVIDLSKNIQLIEMQEDDHDHSHSHSHDDGELDPHYWTDPNMAIIMVDTIVEAFVSIDPDNSNIYFSNGEMLKKDLVDLDQDIREVLSKTESDTIISGGHFAFGYFAKEYNLKHLSPYKGFSPNAEPSPQSITSLINTVREKKVNAIFYEELIDPKVGRTIVEETGVELLLLHGAHNLSKDEIESGITYIEIMYQNLENLKLGLGYNE